MFFDYVRKGTTCIGCAWCIHHPSPYCEVFEEYLTHRDLYGFVCRFFLQEAMYINMYGSLSKEEREYRTREMLNHNRQILRKVRENDKS